MEENFTVTEVVTEGTNGPDWVDTDVQLNVVRRWDSYLGGEKMVVTDGDNRATCHFDDKDRLVLGGSYAYFNRLVEVE